MSGSARFRLLIGIIRAQEWKTEVGEISAIISKVPPPPKDPGRGVVELKSLFCKSWAKSGVIVVVVVFCGGGVVVSSLFNSTL